MRESRKEVVLEILQDQFMLLGIYFGSHSSFFLRGNMSETNKFLIEHKIHKMVRK